MNNKKIAAIVLIFVILFLVLVLGIGFFGAIPLIGKWIAFVLACLLVVFAWCSFGWPGDETDESQIHPAGHGAAAGTGVPGEYAGGGSACDAKIGCRFRHFCYRLYCSVGESPGGAGGFRA